jgi:putative hydrolase of HD superfamily
MGHMLVVAIVSYFMTLELDDPCDKRKVNNFFAGLFHDLPEALTRDIVSPVKQSVEGLDDIIHEIEEEQMEAVIYPLLPETWHEEIKYYTRDEFDSKIVKNGKVQRISSDMINELYNDDHFNPVDGQIIRGCDHLSAYIESYLSLSYGVRCEQMVGGHAQLTEKYKNKEIAGIDFSKVFGYFNL